MNKEPRTIMKTTFTQLFLSLLSILFAFSVNAQTFSKDYQDGKLYLKYKDTRPVTFSVNSDNSVDINTVPEILRNISGFTVKDLSRPFYINNDGKLLRTLMLEVGEYNQIETLISRLSKEPALEYVEKVPMDYIDLVPNDSLYNLYNGPQNWNWHLDLIQAAEAWDISCGSAAIKVGIVDNAVWTSHPDLADKIVAQRDVVYGTNNANPPAAGNQSDWSHGTHVSGLVGASTNNGIGIASIGYNVSLIAVKAANNSSPNSISGGYQGIQWAANNGADVINLSWGGPGFSQTNQNLINSVYNMGVVLLAAAGNDNVSTPHYPSNYQNVISVASIDYNDQKSDFSNFNSSVDISSPGGICSPGPAGVLSSVWNTTSMGNYEAYIGTSMACPVAAGLAALVLSVNPNLTPAQVEQILESNADDISAQNPTYIGMLGAGRINAFRSVSNTPFAPTAAFSTPVCTIMPGTSIDFTSNSTGIPSTYLWTFQGATPASSTDTNPSNVLYQNPGTYDVTLKVTNSFGTNTLTLPDYITVTATPTPWVLMTVSDSLPCIAEAVTFTDNSLYSPTSWQWDIQPTTFEFVNGTNASSQTPQVLFLNQGYYNITLTATNANGQSSVTYNNAVNVRGVVPAITFDFEDGTSSYFVVTDTTKSQSGIKARAANNSTMGLHFHGDPVPTGWKGSPTSGTPEQAWNENVTFQAEAHLCGVDAREFTDGVKLSLDLRQTYSLGPKYSWFRVLVNGTQIADFNGNLNFNPATAGEDPWQRLQFDLTPYSGEVFDLTLQACNRFSDKAQGEGDNVLIDNIEISGNVSAGQLRTDNAIAIYPNPAESVFTISSTGITHNSPYEIISSTGHVCISGTITKGSELQSVSTSSLNPGLYLVRVLWNGVSPLTSKIVVK